MRGWDRMWQRESGRYVWLVVAPNWWGIGLDVDACRAHIEVSLHLLCVVLIGCWTWRRNAN